MAHSIQPRPNDKHLSVDEVQERLKKEFKIVIVDAAAGRASTLKNADYLESLDPRVFLGRHEETMRAVAASRQRPLGADPLVRFGDDPGLLISVQLEPSEAVRVGYEGDEHERACAPLVRRCADILGYEIEKF